MQDHRKREREREREGREGGGRRSQPAIMYVYTKVSGLPLISVGKCWPIVCVSVGVLIFHSMASEFQEPVVSYWTK